MEKLKSEISIFWFRRDLRLTDNAGLFHALKSNTNVLPLFIFDADILGQLDSDDRRVPFIHKTVLSLKEQLIQKNTDLIIKYGNVYEVFESLSKTYKINSIYLNADYEPKTILRDQTVFHWAQSKGIKFVSFKDHVIFEKNEIQTELQKPYTVYTPYKNKWLKSVSKFYLKSYPVENYLDHLFKTKITDPVPRLGDMKFTDLNLQYPGVAVTAQLLKNYAVNRDFPAKDCTSKLGIHLRFGTVSPRELARLAQKNSDVWLSELIWRDFFTQILFHFQHVENSSFRPSYEKIKWRESKEDFERWKSGQTGYPLVDAGMRELNSTGYMHNRVRMVTASFLTKHLLMHWSHGERYFAKKLLDYDLAANNGNWQWAAGTGCDAAPYFRVFNPTAQLEKFDKDLVYVKKWVPEFGTSKYVSEIVEHAFARNRALAEYKKGLSQ